MKIVLVYLGEYIPDYFWDNVRHLLLIQNKYIIDIITDKEDLNNLIIDNRVRYFNYSPSRDVDEKLGKMQIDYKFRDGFWRFTLERLFAISQHHKNIPDEKILHFESDVLVMPNFPFEAFENLNSVCWPRVDASRDIASIVFLPSIAESIKFEHLMLQVIEQTNTIDDMNIMSKISRTNQMKIQILPSIQSIETSIFNQNLRESMTDLQSISDGFSRFKGIFDPASIGIWLTGTDPRNFFGITKRFDNSTLLANGSYVNPALGSYAFNELGELFLVELDSVIPIFNLHIHSKNRKYFQENHLKQLRQDVLKSKKRKVYKTLSVQVLSSLIVDNWKAGTVMRFLSWIPAIRTIKNFFSFLKPRL